jgi:hypothetical protein
MKALKELMDRIPGGIPRREIIGKIAQECYVAESTVYRWFNGSINPDPLKKKTAEKVLNDYLEANGIIVAIEISTHN